MCEYIYDYPLIKLISSIKLLHLIASQFVKEYVQADLVEGMSSNSDNNASKELPLSALNHVSYVCNSVSKSVEFYEEVLRFKRIERPSSLNFEGAWLFNYGIGIHLIEAENVPKKEGESEINPKDNHIAFECTNMEIIVQRLEEMNIKSKKMKIQTKPEVVQEAGVTVDQLFFHDPDGYMIEICNCQNLRVH